MANPANLAPPFTRANAAEMARRATVSRLARIQREKDEERQRDLDARALALSREVKPEPDEARRAAILKQIDGLLDDMSGASVKERLAISSAVAKLWALVTPTAGSLKPGRQQRQARPEVTPTPQEPAA